MALLYAILATLMTLLLSPLLLIAAGIDWRGMRQRVGMLPPVPGPADRPLVWFHAASVGEAVGLAGIVDAFVKATPETRVAVSTMTRAGLERAKHTVRPAQCFFLAPLDVPVITRRVVARLRPRALVLVEGELWPSLLHAVRRAGCPVALVNGRMSDRSYPRNRWIRPLMRRMLSHLTVVGAQTRTDADRFIAFGADPQRVAVTGNVKFDAAATAPSVSRSRVRQWLGLPDGVPVIVAGCPRPVEEERAVARACAVVRTRHPDAVVIWAPRHLDRLPDVERRLREAGFSCIRRSRIDGRLSERTAVILLDTLGELSTVYAAADIAFVGATLVPLGGHNLLEPAAHGVPVVFGPHTQNVRESAGALLRAGGGVEVRNGDELAAAFLRLIEHPEARRRMGAAAAGAVRAGAGARERTVALLKRYGIGGW